MTAGSQTVIVRTALRPTRGWVAIDPGELLRFRDLLFEFARRDIKLRYKQTALGIAWVVLQPLFAAAMLNFAFAVVAGVKPSGTSSFLFTFAGLLAWNVFNGVLTRTSNSMVGNSYLVTRVYFPRLILPLSSCLSILLDAGVALVVFMALAASLGVMPGWPVLLLPVWAVLVLCLALGVGLIAAALTVQYRDIQHILPIVIPFMLYASPVAYDAARVPEAYRTAFYLLNPLAAFIDGVRWSLLARPLPPLPYLLWSSLVAMALFMLGAAIFRRTESRFADVI